MNTKCEINEDVSVFARLLAAGTIENLDKVEGAYKTEITALKQNMTNGILTKGNSAYEAKDYSSASKYFEHAYKMSKKDTLYLYYAAATAVNVQEYDRALKLYEELKSLNYTGIEKQYFAINKETGEEEVMYKIDLDKSPGSVRKGSAADPDVTFTIKAKHLVKIGSGKLKLQTAFVQGRLKIQGDSDKAMKFGTILSKLKKM